MVLTIREMIEERASAAPAALALCAPGRASLDFASLAAFVRSTSARLRELGVRRGDRVACALPNGPESATAFLAIASGAACAPLNPTYRKQELDFYLADLAAAAIVVSAGEVARNAPAVQSARERGVAVFELSVPGGAPAGVFELRGDPVERSGEDGEAGAPGPDDIGLVLHTSGTTSRPKLVPLSQRNLTASARNIRTTLELQRQDRCLNVMPLFHIHGLIGVLLSSLSAGAAVAATPGFSAPRFFDWVKELDPTWYSAVPTMHQAVLARADRHSETVASCRLRLIRSSSAALPPSVLAELERVFGVPVIEAYGMTEATHQMACNPLPPGVRKPGSVGPAAGPEVRVAGDDWRALPAGAVGEVCISGANVTAGYESNPEANAASFRDGWFRTGDQGYLDGDGYLFLTGRLKEIINRGGEKISPREIDEVLLEHPDIEQVVAFAMPDPKLGEDVAAAVVLRAGAAEDRRALQAFAAERLADFKLPREIVFLGEIPKGPTGKLQRIGLAERLGVTGASRAGAGAEDPPRAPRTPTERLLSALFGELLEVEGVDASSDFFALGGDSLLAAQLVQRVAEATQVTLPVYELFERPSVARLAAFVDSAERDAAAGELPDAGAGPHELSFSQGGLWVQERLAGGTPINNRLGGVRIRGPLEERALERALARVFERHAVLRASFPVRERRPRQELAASVPLTLPVRDLRAREPGSRSAEVARRARELVSEPFDLQAGPVHRLELLSLAPDEHVLLCVFHHIVFDGWSMHVLVRELARCYGEDVGGAPLPPPAAPHADHALWQRRRVESGALREQVDYWRTHLAGPLPELELPGAGPRDAAGPLDDCEGARRDVVLSDETRAALVELGRAEGTTLFMTLMAAFDVFLHRWSGAEDLVVGTLVSGRSHPRTEESIGLFANSLVLRSDVSGDPTFRELLARVRRVSLAAYASAEVPFEVLVRELKPKMVLGRNPYFDVVFQLRNLPEGRAAAGPVHFEVLDLAPGFARFELLVEAFEEAGRVHTRFEYRTRCFGEELMATWTARWRSILESVARDPDVRISAIALD